ncbi:EAL domain-containing protein [Marinobacteraceae bacterium S3BR75-40.1]
MSRRQLSEDHSNLLKFSSAVMNSGAMIAITDNQGKIEYINESFSTVTGFSLDDVVGQTLDAISVDPWPCNTTLDNPEVVSCLDACWEGEIRCRRADESHFWSAVTVSSVYDDNGRLTNFVVSGIDITELKAANERMEQLALFDSLTGLANRRLFLDRLERALQNAKRRNTQIALLFLDLDQFKRINDTLGHDAGDLLLLTVADRLRSCVRAQDTVARLGGDEFTILLSDIADSRAVTNIAKNVLKTLKAPIRLHKQEVIVSTSIGITLAPSDSDNAENLMKNADLALYRAKDKGRDRHHYFTEELNQKAIRLLHIEQELRHALQYDEFNLLFQPQVDLKTGELICVEALVRWQHPIRGTVSPDDFISIAEETGLIVPIGNWVLRNACMQMKLLQQLTGCDVRVAINLSARQFRDPMLETMISEALDASNLSPSSLEIEVTESMLMDDINAVIAQLQRIKSTGVTITIDDFGTGYSSLRYLKKLPVDVLKVDREFVKDIPDDLNDMEITSAIIAIGHKLGLKVIAEGVENNDQEDFLIINKCDYAQGYYFSRPLTFEDLYEHFGRSGRSLAANA